jgi:hypothetical protein
MKASTYIFNKLCILESDINEHLETLREYAKQCKYIVELGVCTAISTWAFLEGLRLNKSDEKKLISVDINDVPDISFVKKEAKKLDVDFTFIKEDSATVDLPGEYDLLFIDTWHIYGHMKRELEKHHRQARKYIIMHDTEVDKIKGECVRVKADSKVESERSGYPIEEIEKGIGYAIVEFLEAHKDEWAVELHYPNNNGLTILKRIKNV